MKTFIALITILIATPSFAQSPAESPTGATSPTASMSAPTGQPNPQEMMMEMSKLTRPERSLWFSLLSSRKL